MKTVEILANFVSSCAYADLAASTRKAVSNCVMDVLGAAAGGFGHPASRVARQVASDLFARGAATVWFSDIKTSTIGAGFANSMATSVLDIDDGHRAAVGHPGAAIIPAVMAVAEEVDAEATDVIAAIVAGYEVGIRVGAARRQASHDDGSVSTGRWAAVGVAAAIGRLRKISADRLSHALAIAESHAPNLLAADSSGFLGSEVKEGIPWAVVTGSSAVALSMKGWNGYLTCLDDPKLYNREAIVEQLDADFAIETVYYKPYACCRWAHSAIDATVTLIREHKLEAGDIESIRVETFGKAASLNNAIAPPDLISAQFSVPFTVAVAAICGPSALLPLHEELRQRADILALAKRITVVVDAQLDSQYPASVPARVIMRARNTDFERTVEWPRGDPGNRMSQAELQSKFRLLAKYVLPVSAQDILESITGLESGGFRRLVQSLRGEEMAVNRA